jgi:RNA polymerase sigma factor (TIGR02999 family)
MSNQKGGSPALTPQDVTDMLQDWSEGDREVPARLIPLVYDELRRLADQCLRRERPDHTLQPTALVHEAYLRLSDESGIPLRNRTHFFAVAAKVMRRILVDHARRRHALKRGGLQPNLSLGEAAEIADVPDLDLLALDEALKGLVALDQRKGRVVELRFFGGLSVEETAAVLGISAPTVKNEWRVAKAWLRREISRSGRDDGDA